MSTYFTKDHEYIRIEGNIGIVGISDYAQAQLGDVVFVDLPALGTKVTKGGEAAVVESVKAASDVYAPVTGEVVGVNDALSDSPGTINEDPAGAGWFMKIRLSDKGELSGMMNEAEYKAYLETVG